MNISAKIRIRFLSEAEGGRKSPITAKRFTCPMLVDNEYFDCSLILDGISFDIGQEYDVNVVFLSPDQIKKHIFPGKEVVFWDLREIANGTVLDVYI